jgi:hypothetical protein
MLVENVVKEIVKAGEHSMELPYRPMMLLYVRAGTDIISSEEIYESDKIYHNYNLIYHNKTPIYATRIDNTKYRRRKIRQANLSEIYGDLSR